MVGPGARRSQDSHRVRCRFPWMLNRSNTMAASSVGVAELSSRLASFALEGSLSPLTFSSFGSASSPATPLARRDELLDEVRRGERRALLAETSCSMPAEPSACGCARWFGKDVLGSRGSTAERVLTLTLPRTASTAGVACVATGGSANAGWTVGVSKSASSSTDIETSVEGSTTPLLPPGSARVDTLKVSVFLVVWHNTVVLLLSGNTCPTLFVKYSPRGCTIP